jgi:hypothetical protein
MDTSPIACAFSTLSHPVHKTVAPTLLEKPKSSRSCSLFLVHAHHHKLRSRSRHISTNVLRVNVALSSQNQTPHNIVPSHPWPSTNPTIAAFSQVLAHALQPCVESRSPVGIAEFCRHITPFNLFHLKQDGSYVWNMQGWAHLETQLEGSFSATWHNLGRQGAFKPTGQSTVLDQS